MGSLRQMSKSRKNLTESERLEVRKKDEAGWGGFKISRVISNVILLWE